MALQDAWFNDTFVKLMRQGIEIDIGDTTPGLFKGALFQSGVGGGDPDFSASDPAYGSAPWDDNETSGPGYTTGGVDLTVVSFAELSGAENKIGWDFADIQWTDATFEAEGLLVYAPGLSDLAFLFRHLGQTYDVADGTFSITFDSTGIWRAVLRSTA